MPTPTPLLTIDEARRLVAEAGFGDENREPRGSGTNVGIELEWVTVSLEEPTRPVSIDLIRDATQDLELTGQARLSFEPGGQVELSSPPGPLSSAFSALAGDAHRLGVALADHGVGLIGIGLEPGPCRERALHTPRYDAMETYFDAGGPAGRTMMRSTAAVQVNLDLGTDSEVQRRWRAAHDLAPLLGASFAKSPLGPNGPTGFRSTRLAVWSEIDPERTAAVASNGDPAAAAWVRYALAAPIMLVRANEHRHEPQVERLTFAEWIEHGHQLGWPTADDLTYHLTTLFPPVRPRGWIELRMIDSLPAPWWRVAAAVTATLVQDEELTDVVTATGTATTNLGDVAIRDGLTHPTLHQAAVSCFSAALDGLQRAGADTDTISATEMYIEQYVARGRCPADDRLDSWDRYGSGLPVPDNCRALGTDAFDPARTQTSWS